MQRGRLKYSLRTLLIFVLLAGGTISLWKKSAPWVLQAVLEDTDYLSHVSFSADDAGRSELGGEEPQGKPLTQPKRKFHRITFIALFFVLIAFLSLQVHEGGDWLVGWPAVSAESSNIVNFQGESLGRWLFCQEWRTHNLDFRDTTFKQYNYSNGLWLAAIAIDLLTLLVALIICGVISEFVLKRYPNLATRLNNCLHFHLSTLIILTVLAGVMLYANFVGYTGAWRVIGNVTDFPYSMDKEAPDAKLIGWPFAFKGEIPNHYYIPSEAFEKIKLNILINLLLLLATGLLLEYIIRRREKSFTPNDSLPLQ